MKPDHDVNPSKLSHLVLRSHNLERLKHWYMTVLNAKVAFENLPFITFLRYDEEHHRLGIQALPGDAPSDDGAARDGLHHLAFGYDGMHSLLTTYRRLSEAGIRPSFALNHGPTISIYYRDPDGNGVELMIERFENAEGAQRFLDDHFSVRGPGIDIDLDVLVERMRAGASEKELTDYDWSAPVVIVDFNSPRRLRYPHGDPVPAAGAGPKSTAP